MIDRVTEYDTSSLGHGKTWFTNNPPGTRHLPPFVRAVAHALIRERGMSKSHAIAIALSKMKKWSVDPRASEKTRAKALKSVVQWEAMRSAAHARSLSEADVVAPEAVRAQLRKGLSLLDHKRPGWEKEITPGYVAWLLWGGNIGRTWANSALSESRYTPAERQKFATVRRDGGKFPIGDAPHARLALKYLHSSDLTPTEKAAVVKKALAFLAKAKSADSYLKGPT